MLEVLGVESKEMTKTILIRLQKRAKRRLRRSRVASSGFCMLLKISRIAQPTQWGREIVPVPTLQVRQYGCETEIVQFGAYRKLSVLLQATPPTKQNLQRQIPGVSSRIASKDCYAVLTTLKIAPLSRAGTCSACGTEELMLGRAPLHKKPFAGEGGGSSSKSRLVPCLVGWLRVKVKTQQRDVWNVHPLIALQLVRWWSTRFGQVPGHCGGEHQS